MAMTYTLVSATSTQGLADLVTPLLAVVGAELQGTVVPVTDALGNVKAYLQVVLVP